MLKNEGETMLESEDASLDETEAPMDHDEVTNGRRPTHRGPHHLPREDQNGVVLHRRFCARRPGADFLQYFLVRKFASSRKNLVEHGNESRFLHFHIFPLYLSVG